MYISMSISQVEQGVGHAGMWEAKVTPTNLTGLPYLCSCGHSLPPRQPCWGLPCTCQVLAMDQVPMEYHPKGSSLSLSTQVTIFMLHSLSILVSPLVGMYLHLSHVQWYGIFFLLYQHPLCSHWHGGGEEILCQQGSYCTSVCDAVLGAGRGKIFLKYCTSPFLLQVSFLTCPKG